MSRNPVKIEIVQKGEERTLLKVYADGTEKRVPIVKSAKKRRATSRLSWYWELGTGRRRFF